VHIRANLKLPASITRRRYGISGNFAVASYLAHANRRSIVLSLAREERRVICREGRFLIIDAPIGVTQAALTSSVWNDPHEISVCPIFPHPSRTERPILGKYREMEKKKGGTDAEFLMPGAVFGITARHLRSVLFHPAVRSFFPSTARREKIASSPDRRRVDPRLSPPPRNLILPLQKCNRTIERSRRKEENGPAMATRATGRLPVFAMAREASCVCVAHTRARARARSACSHTVAHLHAMHYACTPSSRRDAPRAPRRALSRTHARTHARMYMSALVSQ